MNFLSIYCSTSANKILSLNNIFIIVVVALFLSGLSCILYGYYKIRKEKESTKKSILNIVEGFFATIISVLFFVLFQNEHDKSMIFFILATIVGFYFSVRGIWKLCHSYIYSKEEKNTKIILIKGIIYLVIGALLIGLAVNYFGVCN